MSRPGALRLSAIAVTAAAVATPLFAPATHARAAALTTVIVRDAPGAPLDGDALVASLGGRVLNHIGIINGFTARVPGSAVSVLLSTPGVVSVTPDTSGHLMSTYAPSTDTGSMLTAEQRTGARAMWSAGYTGSGVDVALIDSGVAAVNGLTAPGKVINGPDFSLEAPASNLEYLDTYGHGTHMAGIIAGRDNGVTGSYAKDTTDFLGMAPDARIISLKVADSQGNTDVSQILLAIDWVVRHRTDHGMNIRVLNLSYGTNATQPYTVDPLAYAAEVAWHDGIVVVAAGGNDGAGYALTDPAYDPNILAVGAANAPTTVSQLLSLDSIASFSSGLSGGPRNVDLVAPGAHIQSLRDPGSYIDQTYGSTGLINSRFFRGSGTSQATAMVSGAVALLLQEHPWMTPDQVKALLKQTAKPLSAPSYTQGSGELNLAAAMSASVPSGSAGGTASSGMGSVNGSRGTAQLVQNGITLNGEEDIFGNNLTGNELAQSEAGAATDLDWQWLAGDWTGTSWAGTAWAASWSESTLWSGAAWTDPNWTSHSWSSSGWNSHSWSDGTWASHSWSGSGYSSHSWSRETWQ